MPPKRSKAEIRDRSIVNVPHGPKRYQKAPIKGRGEPRGTTTTRRPKRKEEEEFIIHAPEDSAFDDDLMDNLDISEFFSSSESDSDELQSRFTSAVKNEGSRRSNPKAPLWSDSGKKVTEEELVAIVEGETEKECAKKWSEGPKTTAGYQPGDLRFHCKSGISKELEACQNRLAKGLPLQGSREAERLVVLLRKKGIKSDCEYNSNNTPYLSTKGRIGEKVKGMEALVVKKQGWIPTEKGLAELRAESIAARNARNRKVLWNDDIEGKETNTETVTVTTTTTTTIKPYTEENLREKQDFVNQFGFF